MNKRVNATAPSRFSSDIGLETGNDRTDALPAASTTGSPPPISAMDQHEGEVPACVEAGQTLPAVSPQADDYDGVIDAAVIEVQRVHKVLGHLVERGQRAAHTTLSLLYPLSMRALNDSGFRSALLHRAKIKIRRDTPHHLGMVRAIVKAAGVSVPNSTVHDWSIALWAWEIHEVEPTQGAVRRWISKLADQQTGSRRAPSLLATVKAIVASETKDDRRDLREKKRQKANFEWNLFRVQHEAKPFATFKLKGQRTSQNEYTLLLARVQKGQATILGEVGKDVKTVRTLWQKHRV
ncbi:hypothetical protein [Microvirga tunisiensis]|uniref:Uncharacterized protein n=1 Tax=Microvirga tunisiensis TaxID=2108360 RepID=A0A5N7MT58_9HYPH|nr:hypothetical protein [Microvirga tunisiensis]MPR11655.1 hypothetical protein [Microvirga tunisiensis]MPR29659.1 hypothetical protein [Microvirga tunisiensis]